MRTTSARLLRSWGLLPIWGARAGAGETLGARKSPVARKKLGARAKWLACLAVFGFALSLVRAGAAADIHVPADHATIAAAIAAAAPGDTIIVAAGTHAEGPQIVVDRDLTITGAGTHDTILQATANTSSSGDARGWFLVPAGVVFHLRDLTLDGNGFLIWQALRHTGAGGSVERVHFEDIRFNSSGPSYAGTALALFGTGPVDTTCCTFSNIGRIGMHYFGAGVTGSVVSDCSYEGKGTGDFLDYMFDIGNGAEIAVRGCTARDNRGVASSDGSNAAGLLATEFFGPGTAVTVEDSTFSDNTLGIAIGFDENTDNTVLSATCITLEGNDVGVAMNVADASLISVTSSTIAGNAAGIDGSNALAGTILAEGNFWGAADGPSGAGPGSGDSITANVDADPFLSSAPACAAVGSDCSARASMDLRAPDVLGPDELIRVYLDLSANCGFGEIASAGARLTYDASKVSFVSFAKGADAPMSWSFVFSDTSTDGEVDLVLTDASTSAETIPAPFTDLEMICVTFSRDGVDCDSIDFGFNAAPPAAGPPSNAFPANQYIHYVDVSSSSAVLCTPALNPVSGPEVDDHAFIRGNVNTRGAHELDIVDVTDLASFLFAGASFGFDCEAASDVNNDGARNITDLVTLVQGLFSGGLVTIPPPNSDDPGPGIPGVVVPDGGTIPSVLGCEEGETCSGP